MKLIKDATRLLPDFAFLRV